MKSRATPVHFGITIKRNLVVSNATEVEVLPIIATMSTVFAIAVNILLFENFWSGSNLYYLQSFFVIIGIMRTASSFFCFNTGLYLKSLSIFFLLSLFIETNILNN